MAITWKWLPGVPPCKVIYRGRHFVAVQGGPIIYVGVYSPLPNVDLATAQVWLDDVSALIRQVRPTPVVLAEDFNARSPQ